MPNAQQYFSTEAPMIAGAFTISFRSETTASIPYNSSAATIQAALEALSTIGAGNVLVTLGEAARSWYLTFQNALGSQPIELVTVDPDPEVLGSFGSDPRVITVNNPGSGSAKNSFFFTTGSATTGKWYLAEGGVQHGNEYQWNAETATIDATFTGYAISGGPFFGAGTPRNFIADVNGARGPWTWHKSPTDPYRRTMTFGVEDVIIGGPNASDATARYLLKR